MNCVGSVSKARAYLEDRLLSHPLKMSIITLLNRLAAFRLAPTSDGCVVLEFIRLHGWLLRRLIRVVGKKEENRMKGEN